MRIEAFQPGIDRRTRPLPLQHITATPFEEVRDFFYARHNHIAELDDAAEQLVLDARLPVGTMASAIADGLQGGHGVRIVTGAVDDAAGEAQRSYDANSRVLRLSPHLGAGQQAFQMATQLAFLEQRQTIDAIVARSAFSDEESRRLARIGPANYFAGALIRAGRCHIISSPFGVATVEAGERTLELIMSDESDDLRELREAIWSTTTGRTRSIAACFSSPREPPSRNAPA